MITNKDLPKDPNPAPSATTPETEAASGSKTGENRADDHRFDDHRFAGQRQAEQRAADQWQRQIVAQRNKVATLQARIDRSCGDSCRERKRAVQGPVNSYQARQLLLASQIQQRLNENRRKLEQMQEAARHAGMRTTVYDP